MSAVPRLPFAATLLFACLFAVTLTSAAPDDQTHGFSNAGSDTWAATDGLGRPVADAALAGPPQPDRVVGIFYFLWTGGIPKVYDNTKILAADPDHPAWGPVGSWHYWGEPFFGYYHPEDPWVIRKHAQMLVDAGVDVIICDATNALTYPNVCRAICEVYTQMRAEGLRTPQIAFILHSKTGRTAQKLYDEFYGANVSPELWFRWLGKPLLLAKPGEVPSGIRDFFTLRESWAWTMDPRGWFGDGRDKWPWLDHTPQKYGWHDNKDTPEELTVAVAEHPVSNLGRSHRDGKEPSADRQTPEKGIYFDEQFAQALKVKPQFLFLTGWNEWIATRFVSNTGQTFLGKKLPPGGSFWVDEYNQEYSRDIEPQRGHFEDNYYYQMVSNIRQFKGVRPPPAPTATKTIRFLDDWQDVGPEFLDDAGDTAARNSPGNGGEVYVNTEGRNDIVRAKVARDASTVWFYVETKAPLTPPKGPHWMQLLINSDRQAATGWFGYDYVVNRLPGDGSGAVLERYDAGTRTWRDPVRVPLRLSDNRLYVGVPRAAVGGFAKRLNFEFKWADNVPLETMKSAAEFMEHGDVAPNARFNYVFAEPSP